MSIELLHMDCMDYLRECEDNAFDLAIVDPPYAVGASDGKFGGQKGKESNTGILTKHYANHDRVPDGEYFTELFRVSKNQIIWGANYYPQYLNHSGWVVWDKLTVGPLSDCELAYQSINKLVEKFTCAWTGYHKQESRRYSKAKIHPNQKPVSLYEWLLAKYAKEGDRILDTHLGSGSSAIASHYFGCDFVGIEIDKDYYNAACQRFDDETAQQSLAL